MRCDSGTHASLERTFGDEQPLRDQLLPVGKALARHRRRDGDRIAERVLQGAAALDAPIYLHPADPVAPMPVLAGYNALARPARLLG